MQKWDFKALKLSKLFNTQNWSRYKSQEFPQINHVHSSVSQLLRKWSSSPHGAAASKLITIPSKADVSHA